MPKEGPKISKHTLHFEFSRSNLSSESECSTLSMGLNSNTSRERLNSHPARSDYLSRLFEKKKLKEKSLSKKLHTPFDRRLNRSCWPIELSKVCKIKKKPKEKKKGKPHYKFPRQSKFLKAHFTANIRSIKSKGLFANDSSDTEDDSDKETETNINHKHFYYEPITPQMLLDILQDPEHLNTGATLGMIIAKLRALKVELNPTIEMLKEEVLEKLRCAIKLGMVAETHGYYTIVYRFRLGKLPRKKVDAFWDMWYRKHEKLK